MINLLALIARNTKLTRTSAKHGGEYSGPCPLCRQGADRFKVWPALARWACLGAEHGRAGCGLGGDAIQYIRARDGVGYREACERLGVEPASVACPSHAPAMLSVAYPAPLLPPNPVWQAHGAVWAGECAARLWQPGGERALDYLRGRGLHDATLRTHAIGYHPHEGFEPPAEWGLPVVGDGQWRGVWLPRGIVIPWWIDGALWRLNVRRPLSLRQRLQGQPKYVGPAGFANGLYNAGALAPERPVVLVEGEIDALTVQQAMGDRVAAVATGSTCGSRRAAWLTRLAQAPVVLVAFDVDANGAGDRAAAWWLRALPTARRWRPLRGDVNAMAVAGLDVAAWVEEGVRGVSE